MAVLPFRGFPGPVLPLYDMFRICPLPAMETDMRYVVTVLLLLVAGIAAGASFDEVGPALGN